MLFHSTLPTDHRYTHHQYSHIFVFAFALVYVLQSAVLIASINPIARRLIRLHAYGDAVVAATAAIAPPPRQGSGQGGPSKTAAIAAFDGFRAFRRRFLAKYALPASFLFDRYLIGAFTRSNTLPSPACSS